LEKFSSVSGTPTDKNLVPTGGWFQMDLKWIVTEGRMGSKNLTFGRTLFAPGGSAKHALHTHLNAEEVIMVLKGRGTSRVGDEVQKMKAGDICFIPQGVPHSFENFSQTQECEIIFVYGGAPTLEKAGYAVVG
jgi:mannose-6-phosphate isomerase-like protein (cupin superfamily)